MSEKLEFLALRIAVITVSDTRAPATDRSGDLLQQRIEDAGHTLSARLLVKDEQAEIECAINTAIDAHACQAVLLTGGTGMTARDVTPEVIERICSKLMPGFGEMFRHISYEKIATSALQSRATAGVYKRAFVFALPGSPSACRDAWDGILVFQLDIRHKPCNCAELLDRL